MKIFGLPAEPFGTGRHRLLLVILNLIIYDNDILIFLSLFLQLHFSLAFLNMLRFALLSHILVALSFGLITFVIIFYLFLQILLFLELSLGFLVEYEIY